MDSESNCSRSSRGDRVTDWLWGDRLETAKILILRAELLGWEGSLKIWCVDRGQSSYPDRPPIPGSFLATAPQSPKLPTRSQSLQQLTRSQSLYLLQARSQSLQQLTRSQSLYLLQARSQSLYLLQARSQSLTLPAHSHLPSHTGRSQSPDLSVSRAIV